MFSKAQLNFLMAAQSGDDWSPNGFLQRTMEVGQHSDIPGEEYNELMAMLERLTYEQVRDLQMALMILTDLPLAY